MNPNPSRSQVIMRRAVEPWFFSFALLAFTTTGIIPILVPLFISQQGHAALEVGLILSAIGAGMLTAPLWGMVVSRFRCHRLLGSGGAFVVCASILGLSRTHDLGHWCLLTFLMGCGVGAAFTVSNLLIIGNHPDYEVDARIGWLQTFVTLGTVAGLVAAGVLSRMPLEVGFAFGAATSGAAALLGALTMRSPRIRPLRRVLVAVRNSGAHAITRDMLKSVAAAEGAVEEVRPETAHGLYVLILIWIIANLGMNGLNALYPLVMRSEFGIAPWVASLVLSAATAVSALLYVKSSRMTHVQGGRSVLALGLAGRTLALGAMMVLGLSSLPLHQVAALALVASATVMAPLLAVSSTILTARLAPDKAGGLGLYNGASALAGLLGPVLGGHLADARGYSSVIVLALACGAVALALTRFLPGHARP